MPAADCLRDIDLPEALALPPRIFPAFEAGVAERFAVSGVSRSSLLVDSSLRFFGGGFFIPFVTIPLTLFGRGRFLEGISIAVPESSSTPGLMSASGDNSLSTTDRLRTRRVLYSFCAAAMALAVASSRF